MKNAYLVCVTSINNNKYYKMEEQGDGTFISTYGRIGVTATQVTYPMSRWNSIYNSKLQKGYEDKTELVSITIDNDHSQENEYKTIADRNVAALIDYLRKEAKETVQKNYTIGADKVTLAMVDTAQVLLDDMSNSLNSSIQEFNEMLLEVFRVIPRKMTDVNKFLATKKDDYEKSFAESRICSILWRARS